VLDKKETVLYRTVSCCKNNKKYPSCQRDIFRKPSTRGSLGDYDWRHTLHDLPRGHMVSDGLYQIRGIEHTIGNIAKTIIAISTILPGVD
jgi:hypothetical protein